MGNNKGRLIRLPEVELLLIELNFPVCISETQKTLNGPVMVCDFGCQ
jgi:hypothetical protein